MARNVSQIPSKKKGRIKRELFKRQKGRCEGCKAHFGINDFTIDHILPASFGGTNMQINLQLLCYPCNSIKGSGTMTQFFNKITLYGYIDRSKLRCRPEISPEVVW